MLNKMVYSLVSHGDANSYDLIRWTGLNMKFRQIAGYSNLISGRILTEVVEDVEDVVVSSLA